MKTEKGVHTLSYDQHSPYFNIVAIEFHIEQLQKINIDRSAIFKHVSKFENKLKLFTKGLSTEELFLEIIELSSK